MNTKLIQLFQKTKISDEYDKHPNEVVKNEELTYNSNAGFSSLRPTFRLTIASGWMPQQLFFVLFTVALVIIINYILATQTLTMVAVRQMFTSQTVQSDDRRSSISSKNCRNNKIQINYTRNKDCQR